MVDTGPALESATPRVFISHAVADRAAAERLRSSLQQLGANVSDPDLIPIGENILASISKEIERSDIVAILVSPQSSTSDWLETETSIAVGRVLSGGGGRVVPVLLEGAEPPFLLREFRGIRVRSSEDIDKLARQLATLPLESQSSEPSLQRSAALQRLALDHERIEYLEETRARQDAFRDRAMKAAASAATLTVAAAGITAAIAGSRSGLAVGLQVLVTFVAATASFFVGRLGRQHDRYRADDHDN